MWSGPLITPLMKLLKQTEPTLVSTDRRSNTRRLPNRQQWLADGQPKAGEVLIRVRAKSVCAAGWHLRSFAVPAGFDLITRLFFGIWRPRWFVLGIELAGEVEPIGKSVTKFKYGD